MKICNKCKNAHNKSGAFCSRKCANSRLWSDDHKNKLSNSAKLSIRVKKANLKKAKTQKKRQKNQNKWEVSVCSICEREFEKLKSSTKKTCSKKCFSLLPMGGLRHNSGIGKSGWYKGFWLNSTYELAYVIYHIENNISIKKCDKFYYYTDPKTKKEKRYYPDFVVNGRIIEIKGYKTDIDEIKIATCNAILLQKEDLREVFEYVENITGIKINNLHSLYE